MNRALLFRCLGFLALIALWNASIARVYRSDDLLQYYAAGRMVAMGQADHLYDQSQFRSLQDAIAREVRQKLNTYDSLYPPTVGLVFAPLSQIPYAWAVWVSRCLQLFGLLIGLGLLFGQLNTPPLHMLAAVLGVAAFLPLWVNFGLNQIAGLWFFLFSLGLVLYQKERRFAAGLVLSLLALKPQLVVGSGFWLLIRRDGRALSGMALGGLGQLALTAMILGPGVPGDYLQNLGTIAQIVENIHFAPSFQHGIGGTLSEHFGLGQSPWPLVAQGLAGLIGGYCLWRICRRRGGNLDSIELSAVVLFSLLLSPHLLTYDLTLLLIPILCLWLGDRGSRAAAVGRMLFVTVSVFSLFAIWRFSLVPLVVLLGLTLLSREYQLLGEHCEHGPRKALKPRSPVLSNR